jgi:uncharacterized lipoprotein YmbA
MHITRLAIVGMALLLFGACINLGASKSTAPRFYLLESTVEPRMVTGTQGRLSNLSLCVGPVTLPPYLDRPQLVTRMSGSELRIDEFNQWAEPLNASMLRVIQENLSVLSGARHVHSYPTRRATVIDYQISLDVLRFDADTQGRVTLKSVWRIVSPDSDQRLKQNHSTIVQPSTSTASADVVDAMNTALAALSEEMVYALVDELAQ